MPLGYPRGMAKRKSLQAGASASAVSPADKPLSESEIAFCRHYVRWGNATGAYHHAYPEAGPGTCGVEGCRFLKKPNLQLYIKMLRDADAALMNIDRHSVLRVFAEIAYAGSKESDRITAAESLYDKLALGNAGDDSGISGADARRVSGEARQLAGRRKAG